MPPQTADLRRVSLNPAHWRQARRLLALESVLTGVIGAVGLLGVAVSAGHRGWRLLGVPLTLGLSVVMIVIALGAAASLVNRSVAKVFTLAMSAASLALMIICGVAAVHHAPGPLGFTAAAILLWTALFCYSIASLIWLLPDQIAGPAWVKRRERRRPDIAQGSSGGADS
jgi:hypothetical protein